MTRLTYLLITLVIVISCKKEKKVVQPKVKQSEVVWTAYDESEDIKATQKLEQSRMHLKLINSKVSDKNDIWKSLSSELDYFSEEKYDSLKSYILEKDIPEIQQNIKDGKLTYEELVLFYIYRIRKYESDNGKSLNSIISLNPKVVSQARALDKKDKSLIDINSIYGMPIMLKDNIGASSMMTTAGSIALKDNKARNAYIVNRLLLKNALILGKANLSEWAYFLCSGCPVGYSAIGGQTLNPYGRLIFESGGSSSGSGATVAANFCVAAVGTETSGSILSPSSQNSIVGLKPTIGMLSRTGIVPISSTLDTPGPMAKSIVDTSILFMSMLGKDPLDEVSIFSGGSVLYEAEDIKLEKRRLGVIKELLNDSLYKKAVDKLKNTGAEIVEIEPKQIPLPGFLSILNMDMKADYPKYVKEQAAQSIPAKTIEELVVFNEQDSLVRIPYGQQLFRGILSDKTNDAELKEIKARLQKDARAYFDQYLVTMNLQAILSINNYHAGYAAVAKYPALTIPMGYTDAGEPKGLTFIGKAFSDFGLLRLGFKYEQISKERKAPQNYAD